MKYAVSAARLLSKKIYTLSFWIKNYPSDGGLKKFDLFFGFDSFNFAKFLTGMEIGYSFILLTKPYLSHYLFWAGLFTGLSVELYGIIQRKQQIMHFSWIFRIIQAILFLGTVTRPLLNIYSPSSLYAVISF